MTRDEFEQEYRAVLARALDCEKKAENEGLLALEDGLDAEKVRAGDIFEYGIRLVVDGTDREKIRETLSDIAAQETDEYRRILKMLQKEAVLMICEGTSPTMLSVILNSCLDRAIAGCTGALWSYPDYEAIRFNPNYAPDFVKRGNAYSDQKDYDRTIADFTEAIRSTSLCI